MTRDRVLVVDDSPQNRMVAQGHLEAAGYEVVAVGSGEEALATLAAGSEGDGTRIDLVVLDVLMPGLGGFETCRRIRATPGIAELPVLFLTALGDREATTPALEAGGDDLLPKPFHRAELLLRVRALIRQRRTTIDLRQAMRALEDQNEALRRIEHDKRRVSQLIVHDLKSPIGAVMANGELLRTMLSGEPAEIAGDILIAVQALDRTTRDLLDLSRAEDGVIAPRRETFSLLELAIEIAASLRGYARWTQVTIETEVGVTTMHADRELIRRLLQNLVHNAVQHAPAGSSVRLEAVREGDDISIRVLDNGPGVKPEDAERIFDRYVTSVGTPERARGGSHGLGLAFCRLAAEAHGGKIWVEDRSPGATFCVRIPSPPP